MTLIINQRWPLGNLMDGFPNGKKQNKLSFVVYLKKDILKNLIKILSYISFSEHQKKHILRNLIVIEI